jgi:hypothetical protein
VPNLLPQFRSFHTGFWQVATMKLLLFLLLLLRFGFTNASAQIAYVRVGTEIRIIDPDSKNDRQL